MKTKPNSDQMLEVQQNQFGLQIEQVRKHQSNCSLLMVLKKINAVSYLRFTEMKSSSSVVSLILSWIEYIRCNKVSRFYTVILLKKNNVML